MTTMGGCVKDNRIVPDSDLLSLDGKRVLITFYDEGENPYEIKKPIPPRVRGMLDDFVRRTVDGYGSHVKKIILYGSYARGDYREYSDLDIMVLVDYPDAEIGRMRERLSDISFDIGDQNDLIIISPVMQNVDHFNKWVGNYPFYDNIVAEGIVLYGE